MDEPMETVYGIQRKQSELVKLEPDSRSSEVLNQMDRPSTTTLPVSEEFSSSGDSKTEEEQGDKKSLKDKDKDKEKDEEIVRVYDGNLSLRKRNYRSVTVPKNGPAQVLLEAAMRTFHISDDSKNYYLVEAIEKAECEKELDVTVPLRAQLTNCDGKRPSILLRHRERDLERGQIRVYPGKVLGGLYNRQTVFFKHIPVTDATTSHDVIERALRKFGADDLNASEFSLVEVLLDKGVQERIMASDEKPWEITVNSRKECLRRSRMTRFLIKQNSDPHGPQIAVYIGNLPMSLSQKQYEKILLDIIGKENKWSKFDVIYYEYGSLVVLYNSPEHCVRAFNILQDASFDDKSLLVLLLPKILPHMIPDYVTPLLVLVNVKSGGQQGMELIRSFRKLLNPHQCFDLMNGGPLPGLYVFRNLDYFKIMVCGGDGTVGWALSCLDNVGQDAQCDSPPMAIVPLGTGNDLARVLRWGPGYSGAEDPLHQLRDVIEAEEIKLDRWTVIFHPNEKEIDEMKMALASDTATATTEDTTSIFVMNNYFGIGLDADLCLDFHMAREENPDKFNSRLHNKGVYAYMGIRKMLKRRSCKDLHRMIKVEVDGKLIEVPPVEGLIILNILSWGSGANPWGPEKEDTFSKPTHYDGMLEIVGVSGVVHMGQIQSGLRGATRIAQGGHLRIHLLTDLPVQVDGEPWIQPAGQVVVLRSALKATMLKKTKNKIKRRNTEPSIYFPNDPSLSSMPTADADSGPV
jgi:diacylglycerol kinase (ATP)